MTRHIGQTREQRLEATLARLLTGLRGRDTAGCEWYEGVLYDAIAEAEQDLGIEPEPQS